MKKKRSEVPKTVLALDLATISTGYSVVDEQLNLIDYGLIHYPSSRPIEARLFGLINDIENLLKTYSQIEAIALEDQFLRKGVKTLKALSQARGAVMVLACSKGKPVIVINNKSAKKATGKGNATKEQVRAKVCDKYNLNDDIDENITDAIAIAWAYYMSIKKEEPR